MDIGNCCMKMYDLIVKQAVFIFVMTAIGPTQFGDYIFPEWADIFGWMIGASTLAPFVIFVIYRWIKGEVTI